jgi:hypothetical protein
MLAEEGVLCECKAQFALVKSYVNALAGIVDCQALAETGGDLERRLHFCERRLAAAAKSRPRGSKERSAPSMVRLVLVEVTARLISWRGQKSFNVW